MVRNSVAIGLAILAVLINILIHSPFGTPVLMALIVNLLASRARNIPIGMVSLLTYVFALINDIGMKIRPGAPVNGEAIAWITLSTWFGLGVAFLMLASATVQREGVKTRTKFMALFLFAALSYWHIAFFSDYAFAHPWPK